MDCPHPTTAQLPHPLGLDPIPPTGICPVCGLAVRVCGCGAANRLIARYCTSCGEALEMVTPPQVRLAPPGRIREALRNTTQHPLSSCLPLPDNHTPYIWQGVREGVFVFSRNAAVRGTKLALHFVPGYRFEQRTGRCLHREIPPDTLWVRPPLTSEDGLFLACSDQLLFSPAHGYQTAFEPQVWHPSNGTILDIVIARGHVAADSGGKTHLLVLFRPQRGALEILRGNTQQGQWGERPDARIALPALDPSPPHGGGYLMGLSPFLPPDTCWLYDGATLTVVSLATGQIVKTVPLHGGVAPAPLLSGRMEKGWFDPFLYKAAGASTPSIAYPAREDLAQRLIKPAMLTYGDGAHPVYVPVQGDKPVWVRPDPWEEGLLVGSEQGLSRFSSHNEEPVTPKLPKLSEGIICTEPGWFVAVTGLQANSEAMLVAYKCSQEEDRHRIDEAARGPFPPGQEVARGMPPLWSGDLVFVALRSGGRPDAPVTVHQVPILAV